MNTAFWCGRCARTLGPAEIRIVRAGQSTMNSCGTCGGIAVEEESRVAKPLAIELARSCGHAFQPMALAQTVAVLLVTGLAGFAPFVGAILAGGIRFAYLFAVLRSASVGRDVAAWSGDEIGSIETWVLPFVRFLAVFLFWMGPSVLVSVLVEPGPIAAVLALAGAAMMPAAFIVAAHASTLGDAVNPVSAVRLVLRIPGSYVLACGMLLGMLVIATLVVVAVFAALGPSMLARVIAPVLAFQPLVCASRMLGTLVWEEREEL